MARRSRRRVVRGRIAQVDLLLAEGGLVLSVGPISLWLDLEDAGDLAKTLAQALTIEAEVAVEQTVRAQRASVLLKKPRPN